MNRVRQIAGEVFGKLKGGKLMSKRIISVFLLLAVFAPLTVFAQSGDWERVKRLKSGAGIVLSNKQGQEFEGEVQLVSDTEIVFVYDPNDLGGRIVRVKREDVVEIRKQRSRFSRQVKGGLLAGGIGLGAGAGIGAILEARSNSRGGGNDDPGLAIFVLGFLGTVFGAGTGFHQGPNMFSAKGGIIYVAP